MAAYRCDVASLVPPSVIQTSGCVSVCFCGFIFIPLSIQMGAGEESQNEYRGMNRTVEGSLIYLKLQCSFLDRKGS